MLDEFLLPIFIEEDPNGMQLQQDGALPNFHTAVRAVLNCKEQVRESGSITSPLTHTN
jgi:hypothetical protein